MKLNLSKKEQSDQGLNYLAYNLHCSDKYVHCKILLFHFGDNNGNYFMNPTYFTQIPEMKIAEFANSIDPDEVAHDETPHLDLHCLPTSL